MYGHAHKVVHVLLPRCTLLALLPPSRGYLLVLNLMCCVKGLAELFIEDCVLLRLAQRAASALRRILFHNLCILLLRHLNSICFLVKFCIKFDWLFPLC
jgi:hypothetical protein